jgi:flagellar protein FlbT
MPLKLSLKPGEKVVVNGAVVQNGERRSTLVLQNRAYVLREKDILQAEDATTPARRIYFPIMMMYLDQGRDGPYYEEFVLRMTEFMSAIRNPDMLAKCVDISRDVMSGDFYKALNTCRILMDYEEERLVGVSAGLPESGCAG